jgi:hypothetical protein
MMESVLNKKILHCASDGYVIHLASFVTLGVGQATIK